MVETSQPITVQQQIVQTTPIKHHIPLPQSSPPELRPIDPLPPPHYDEATKRIEDNKKQQLAQTLAAQNVPPLAKCMPITQVQALSKVRKGDPMPQALKDVYEILSKNGEILEPDTPESGLSTPNGSQVMMINPNLMFDNRRVRGVVNEMSSGVSNDAPSSDIPSSLLLDSGSDLLNLPVLSPMQQDCMQSDPEETLDKLLAQAQQTNNCHTPRNSPFHQSSASVAPSSSQLLSDFNDFELLEFPMDIEDDAYHHHAGMMNHQSENHLSSSGSTRVREMNPSLTPSLNELIQIQQQQQSTQSNDSSLMNGYQNSFSDSMNNNSENSHCSSNSHFNNETPMDFENLLSNFEIPTNFDSPSPGLQSNNQSNRSCSTNYDTLSSPSHHFGNHCYNSNVHSPLHTTQHHHYHTNNHHLNHHHENILEFFNDDFRMGVGDSMSCEVDNLLCNI